MGISVLAAYSLLANKPIEDSEFCTIQMKVVLDYQMSIYNIANSTLELIL